MNAQLLVVDDAPRFAETEPSTRLGGRPLAPSGYSWPACGDCDQPLQFLAQLRDGDALLLLFSCPDVGCVVGGGPRLPTNHVARVPAAGGALVANEERPPLPFTTVTARSFDQAANPYDEARLAAGAFVYGMLGGELDSVSEHRPRCPSCAVEMRFVASLEEGRLFNFAGVQAFVFTCDTCGASELYVDDFF
ncbi:MAG: hypothetical protein U0228_33390 [Myxococcaceae bacterium]